MKPALFTFLQLLVLFKTKTDICGHIVTPMMHWAIWYSSRVSAVRPGASSPPTARQPARRQRSASASLYLSCRVVQSDGSLGGSPEGTKSEDLNLLPDGPELVSVLIFTPLLSA